MALTRSDIPEELADLLDEIYVYLGQARDDENDVGDFIFSIETAMGKFVHLVSPEAVEIADMDLGDFDEDTISDPELVDPEIQGIV